MTQLPQAELLARVRRQNPTWVIVANENGTYTARRDFWGNQQLVTVPTLEELEVRLQPSQRDPRG